MRATASDRRRAWRVGVVLSALVGAIGVWLLATRVFPYHSLNHDEAVYLQQASMLLEGRLFLSPPVDDVFRPWFFVRDGGNLYPKYAPVPAAVFALGELFGGARLALAGVAAATVSLVALVGQELFDRSTGLAAAVFVLGSPLFLLDSAVFLPYAPTTMFNLTFFYCYLRADRTNSLRWAAGAGAGIGLAFFARPYTAVLFALPVVAHAVWTLRLDYRSALPRHAVTAALGVVGVGVTLGYNAYVTGSPLLFPYEVFAPKDGLGFGYREILGHDVEYTVALALRANALVLEQFVTTWIAGGPLGFVVAIAGVGVAALRGFSSRQAILLGQAVTIVVGNVYFWGNYNILGDIDRVGDGLIVSHGPYYHFDLLLVFGVFAAVGVLALFTTVNRVGRRHLPPRAVRVTLVVAVLCSTVAIGGVTATSLEERIEKNTVATDTYERVYQPVEQRQFDDAVVFLPTPYGDWQNHPFQALRNDPDFDGQAVYALDERPFAVVDAYPNRTLYRLGIRGEWAPYEGTPRASRLQEVEHVAGSTVTLNATVGLPEPAYSVSAVVRTDEASRTYTTTNASNVTAIQLHLDRLYLDTDRVRVTGRDWTADDPIPIDEGDAVHLTVFVDQGPGASFSYELDAPIRRENETIRMLTPRIERCVAIDQCGGEATYLPDTAPDGTFVRTELRGTGEKS